LLRYYGGYLYFTWYAALARNTPTINDFQRHLRAEHVASSPNGNLWKMHRDPKGATTRAAMLTAATNTPARRRRQIGVHVAICSRRQSVRHRRSTGCRSERPQWL